MFKPGDVLNLKGGRTNELFIVQKIQATDDVGQILTFDINQYVLARKYEIAECVPCDSLRALHIGDYVTRTDGVNPHEHHRIEEVNGRAIRLHGIWHLDVQFEAPLHKALNNPFSIGDMVVCTDPCGSLRKSMRYLVTGSDTTCIQIDNSTTRAKFGRFKLVSTRGRNTILYPAKEAVTFVMHVERQDTDVTPKLISVRFPSGGKLYTYYTELDVEIDDTVVVPNGLDCNGKYKLATVRGIELNVSKAKRAGLKQVVDVVDDHDHSHCNKRVTRISGYESSRKQIQANLKNAELRLRNALGMQGIDVSGDQLLMIAEHNNLYSRARDEIRNLKHKLECVELSLDEAMAF